jgi:quercetin dioxygenase-like cupin family protein
MELHGQTRGHPEQRDRRRRLALLLAGAAVAALVLAVPPGAEADHVAIHGVPLTTPGHNTFTDDVAVQVRDKPDGRPATVVNMRDASNIAVGEFTIQPQAWFPWHTHPGTGLVAIAQGDLVFIYADDCIERPYPQGTAFVDPGVVHTAYNPSDEAVTVAIATFLDVPAGADLADAVDPTTAEALNEKCGTDAPIPQPESSAHH